MPSRRQSSGCSPSSSLAWSDRGSDSPRNETSRCSSASAASRCVRPSRHCSSLDTSNPGAGASAGPSSATPGPRRCRALVPPPTRPGGSRGELRRIAREDGGRIADALTFRMAVETGAAQVLAQSAGGFDSDVLLARLASVNGAVPDDYRRMDTLFHLAIAELTGSSLLAAAGADARMRLNDLLNAIPVLQRNIDHTAAQHTAIAEAILAGDTGRAQRAVAEHLEGTAALLRGFLTTPAPPDEGAT